MSHPSTIPVNADSKASGSVSSSITSLDRISLRYETIEGSLSASQSSSGPSREREAMSNVESPGADEKQAMVGEVLNS